VPSDGGEDQAILLGRAQSAGDGEISGAAASEVWALGFLKTKYMYHKLCDGWAWSSIDLAS
jgi:hypothetical protein